MATNDSSSRGSSSRSISPVVVESIGAGAGADRLGRVQEAAQSHGGCGAGDGLDGHPDATNARDKLREGFAANHAGEDDVRGPAVGGQLIGSGVILVHPARVCMR